MSNAAPNPTRFNGGGQRQPLQQQKQMRGIAAEFQTQLYALHMVKLTTSSQCSKRFMAQHCALCNRYHLPTE